MTNAILNDIRELTIDELEVASAGTTVVIIQPTPTGTLVISCSADGVGAKFVKTAHS